MPSGPLAGLLGVDLTRALAGPFCNMMQAEMGARVIKVENPDGGDEAHHFEGFAGDQSASWPRSAPYSSSVGWPESSAV